MTQSTLLAVGGHGRPSGPSLVMARTMIIAGFPARAGGRVERHAHGVRLRCWHQASSPRRTRLSSEILLRGEARSFNDGIADTFLVAPVPAGAFLFRELLLSPAHDRGRALSGGKGRLKQLPECPRGGDDLWLGPPPVLELGE